MSSGEQDNKHEGNRRWVEQARTALRSKEQGQAMILSWPVLVGGVLGENVNDTNSKNVQHWELGNACKGRIAILTNSISISFCVCVYLSVRLQTPYDC